MDLSERKLRILQAIVGDFIYSAEPVGSRTLSKKYDMGISPATIRNEMSDLEEMGFLTHPHTSSGRVPSDKAYRLYVDSLMKRYELPDQEKKSIEKKLVANISELDRTIQHAVSLLSELTNLTSFAMTPKQEDNRLKQIRFLPVDERTVVLMIVTETGKVTNTTIQIKSDYDAERLEFLSKVMTKEYQGRSISNILTLDIVKNFETDMEAMKKLTESVYPNFISTLENMLNVDLYLEGLTNIFSIPEYTDLDRARLFMETIQKKHLKEVLLNRENGMIITIGNENEDVGMKDCSLITATYCIDGQCVGKLGVIGPTRIKYDEVLSVIEYMTNNLNRTFQLGGGSKDDE